MTAAEKGFIDETAGLIDQDTVDQSAPVAITNVGGTFGNVAEKFGLIVGQKLDGLTRDFSNAQTVGFKIPTEIGAPTVAKVDTALEASNDATYKQAATVSFLPSQPS